MLRYFSDLHLEANNISKIISRIKPRTNEICILAGDIYSKKTPDSFFKFINNNFEKTFIIAGNHEYFNKDKTVEETNIFISEYFQQYKNISFLNNQYEYYNNYCFVGTTLWTQIKNTTKKNNIIKDFDSIKYNQLHNNNKLFLHDTLNNQSNCVIITHHIPSFSLIDPIYQVPKYQPLQQYFYCDMDDFIITNKNKIKCWIYGHTHMPSNKIIEGIPFLCNPLGYENESYNYDAVHYFN
jgi:predicted phosphohydrolase